MGRIYLIVGLGVTLLVLLTFQVLLGRRMIRVPAKYQFRIHSWTAYVLLALAFVHAAIAVGWVFGWF